MDNRDIFLEQLTSCFDQKAWFASLQNALDGLTEEQAAWKPAEQTNSIWEIVNHLNFWNNAFYKRFQGITPEDVAKDHNTYAPVDGLGWEETVDRCYQPYTDWRNALKNSDEEKLNSAVHGRDSVWNDIFTHFTIHTAYHVGQMVYIRKAQNSWNAENGVKG